MPNLPPGFVLEEEDLPPGFVVENEPPKPVTPTMEQGPGQPTMVPPVGTTGAEEETQDLQRAGRDVNPVSADISALMGLAADPERAANILLKRKYGEGVTVQKGPTGRLEFRNPETGDLQVLNPPGMQGIDILQNIPNGMIVVADLAVGMKGAGKIAKEIGLPSAVTGAGEMARLIAGKAAGLNEEVDADDILLQGAKAAGIEALGAGTMRSMLGIGTMVVNTLKGSAKSLGIGTASLEELEKSFQQSLASVEEFNQRTTGTKVAPTVGQLSRDSYILGLENSMRRTPLTREAFAARDTQSALAFEEYLGQINRDLKLTPKEMTTWEASRQVADKAEASYKGAVRTLATAREKNQATYEAQRAGLLVVDRANNTRLGRAIREGLEVEFKVQENLHRKRLKDLHTDARGLRPLQDLSSTNRKATDLRRALNKTILPHLDDRDRATAAILEGISKSPDKGFTFPQVNEAIDLLYRAERKAVGTEDEALYGGLRTALERDRAKWLRAQGNGRLLGQLEKVELDRRNFVQRTEQTITGKVMDMKNKGLPDEDIFRHVVSTEQNSREVFSALSSNKNISAKETAYRQEARDAVREGILDLYGKMDRPAFFEKYGEIIKPWFSKKQIDTMRKGDDTFVRREKRLDELEKAMDNFFKEGGLDFRNPEVVNKTFREVWSSPGASPANVEKFAKWAAAKDPDALQLARNATLDQMYVTMGVEGRLDFTKLANALEGQDGAKRIGAINALFGSDYTSNLRTLQRAVQVTMHHSGTAPPPTRKSALNDIARAYVGLFTTPGRALTAYQKVRGRSAERLLAEALADPEKLRSVVALSKVTMQTKAALSILTGFGAYTLMGTPSEPAPMPEVVY